MDQPRQHIKKQIHHFPTEIRIAKAMASLVAQRIKPLPAMQGTRIQSLGWEDPLEKEMATHFSILAWRIPWTRSMAG